jgi:hypothetical protein
MHKKLGNYEIVFLKGVTERGGASKRDFSAEKYSVP